MNNFTKIARGLVPLLIAVTLQGCTAAAIGVTIATAGAGAGMSVGVEHTLNGIVYKTFAASANDVRFATLKTLDQMGMALTADEATKTGWQLSATANDRSIDVQLERLTDTATRMRVVANEGWIIFKDSATATEIILQTAQTLQDDSVPARASERHRKSS
jgi:outer membrane scaffolding protein for murein synthesis (MipA/OmpV family)